MAHVVCRYAPNTDDYQRSLPAHPATGGQQNFRKQIWAARVPAAVDVMYRFLWLLAAGMVSRLIVPAISYLREHVNGDVAARPGVIDDQSKARESKALEALRDSGELSDKNLVGSAHEWSP